MVSENMLISFLPLSLILPNILCVLLGWDQSRMRSGLVERNTLVAD